MLRTFLRTKLHRAAITHTAIDYEGSISIDPALCRAAGLMELEQVDIYDITNGARFTTYVIYGEAGQVQVNGAAARLVAPGDRIIVAAYATLTPDEIPGHAARVLVLDEKNVIKAELTQPVRAP